MKQIFITFILVLALCVPSLSYAAITWVSTTDATNQPGVITASVSVTVSSGTDRMLVVSAQGKRSGASVENITDCIFNGGESFTFVARDERINAAFSKVELWYLLAPTVTTANVVCTYVSSSNGLIQTFSVTQLDGVAQSGQPDATGQASGTSGTLSATVTTVAANSWIIDSAWGLHDSGLTVGSGQTMRTDRLISVDGLGVSTVDGKATPGAETMDWTQTSSDWCYVAASFSPSGSAAAIKGGLMMLGVGQ